MTEQTKIAAKKKRLGDIFVERGLITPITAERIFQKGQQLNRRFGTILEDLDLVTSAELTSALAEQFECKLVENIDRLSVSSETLGLIPVEIAMQHMVFPLKYDGRRLALAMADPSDLTVSDLLTGITPQIIPYIASKKDLRAAICKHYLSKVATRALEPTIVIVENDEGTLDFLSNSLQGKGYRIHTARDGMDAFKTVIAQGPHVVLTDLEIPKLNGYALLSALRNIPETKHIPVILLTEKPQNENEELRAFDQGFFDVIFKPLSAASIQARVKRAFHFYDHQYRGY